MDLSTLAYTHSGSSQLRMWGILCAIGAVAFFAVLDTTSQLVGMAAPVLMVQWVRYTVQTLSASSLLLPQHGLAGLRVHRPRLQLLRALLMMCTTGLAFVSLRYVPVGDFTAIVMTIPVMVTLVSMVVLKERVTAARWALVALSFAGTLLVVHPGKTGFQLMWLLPFALAMVGTAFQVLTAHMMRFENGATTHFYSGLIGMLLTSVTLPFVWQSLPWDVWKLLLMIACASSVGHMLLIMAYQRAGAPLATAYQYGQLIFAMLGGYLVFGRVPDGLSLLGIAVIATCGVLGVWLTFQEGKAATAVPVLDT